MCTPAYHNESHEVDNVAADQATLEAFIDAREPQPPVITFEDVFPAPNLHIWVYPFPYGADIQEIDEV